MRLLSFCCAASLVVLLTASIADAQVNIAGYDIRASRQESVNENQSILLGNVELNRGDTSLFADYVEFFKDRDLAIARGNVVLSEGNNRIAADSAEFNTKTMLGTFHQASGMATIQPPRSQGPTAGIAVPQMSGQDTDVYFFGETVEKQGQKKYKITNGGFSTCVQPTPRWDLTADTVVLNLDHYTLLRQAIFKVKGVPMMYLPVFYYPTQEDGRATGFLIPTYSQSTLRGQSVTVPFFWAIDRSSDATLFYDYYSKTGGGGGAEYRYERGGGSNGNITAYRLDDRETVYDNGSVLPGSRSYTVRGTATQQLPARMLLRATADYFSNLLTNQTLNTNLANAASSRRYYGANIVGVWRTYSLNATIDRSENFGANTSSAVGLNSPRIVFSRNERPITANSRLYFSGATEVANLGRQTVTNGEIVQDWSYAKVDLSPQIRYPFTRWQWFTINTSASWRQTYYTRSLQTMIDEQTGEEVPTGETVNDGVSRGFGTASVQAIGPVFTRIFNTPNNGYAERFKHLIEPQISLSRTTGIESRARIIQIDANDATWGDTTQLSYGLNNRLYAKRRIGQTSQAQEIVALEITQTYYSDARQSLADRNYATSMLGGAPSKFSPVAANLRVTPAQGINGTLRAEVDSRSKRLKTLSLNSSYSWSQTVTATVGWSHKYFVPELPGFDNPDALDHYLNASANLRTRDNQYGLNTSFSFDVLRSSMTQMQVMGFYNAQCCGLAIQYLRNNYAGISLIPANHQFFLSFSLAGLGNFSPFSGGLNGMGR